jgi:hypothetical protein
MDKDSVRKTVNLDRQSYEIGERLRGMTTPPMNWSELVRSMLAQCDRIGLTRKDEQNEG